ncbi:MAG: phosphotransferase [Chthoniobacteraceae bacterium]
MVEVPDDHAPAVSRRDIYYWKCDRPAAFHGTHARHDADADITAQLREELSRHFDAQKVVLSPGAGQGNHLTWNAEIDGRAMFVRVENGPERDGHLAVESVLLDQVRAIGIPTPIVHGCDATRSRVPFAWQALERITAPDLNHWFKQGRLDAPRIAFDIGASVAKWQGITFDGFGPPEWSAQSSVRNPSPHRGLCGPLLIGCHSNYADYFRLRLAQHLAFLVERQFLSAAQSAEIEQAIVARRDLLQLSQGCLVHKDLALWNILGSETDIAAFIDFDDAISGDPMDDLSLLACFHDAAFLRRAFDGYESIRPLPPDHLRRFWLHLLRNMIVKAVIRNGAGYFDRDDGFFLIGSGSSGANLKRITHERIALALRGLAANADLSIL